MEYIKSRWSSGSNEKVQESKSQDIETSCNPVTYTNSNVNQAQNPIIISTHHGHPQQIAILHEVRNPSLKVTSDMTSPTDSFHSVVSSFHNEKREGKVNLAFAGSSANMNNQVHHPQQQQSQLQHPQNQVFHQSYWSWQVPWSTWNQREKIFLLIIVILSLCILSLTSVLSVILQKNLQYREILFDKFGFNV